MKSAPLAGIAALIVVAVALAACAPKTEPEIAVELFDPAYFEGLEFSPPYASESDYIKGLTYHGGGWGLNYRFGETEDWFWLRYWRCERKPQAKQEYYRLESGDFEVPFLAILDLADAHPKSVEFDAESSTLSAGGGDASLSYKVHFTKTESGLERTVYYKTGHVQYVTFDESILDAPVSRDVRTPFTGSRHKNDEIYFEVDPPADESDRIGVMILWEPRAWIPLPAIAFLPFDEIENHQINFRSVRHTLTFDGTGLGTKLRGRLSVLDDGHTLEIVDVATGKVLITSREVYEVERDETREP